MEEMNMPRQQRRDGLNINMPSKSNGNVRLNSPYNYLDYRIFMLCLFQNDIRKRSTSNEELTYIVSIKFHFRRENRANR